MTKMKLAARNTEAEAAIDNLQAKLAQIEKAKSKIQIGKMIAFKQLKNIIN